MNDAGKSSLRIEKRRYQCSDSTIDKIIVTAERLFAEHGIGGVSLRQIAREAEQKNVMATRYHFGSMEALVRAVYERRVEEDDRKRLHFLSQLSERGLDRDLRTILAATIRPLADELDAGPSGWNYLRFQSQVRLHSTDLYRELIIEGPYGEGVRQAIDMMIKLLPVMPEAVVHGRTELAFELVLSGFAERARRLSRETVSKESNRGFVSILIDSVAGMLSAPAYPVSSLDVLDTLSIADSSFTRSS